MCSPRLPYRAPFIGFAESRSIVRPLVLASVFPSTSVSRPIYCLSYRVGRYSACLYWPVCFSRLPYWAPIYWFCVKLVDILPASTSQCLSLDFRTGHHLLAFLQSRAIWRLLVLASVFASTSVPRRIYWFCVKSGDILPASTGQCVSLDLRAGPHLLVLRKVSRYSARFYWEVCPPSTSVHDPFY